MKKLLHSCCIVVGEEAEVRRASMSCDVQGCAVEGRTAMSSGSATFFARGPLFNHFQIEPHATFFAFERFLRTIRYGFIIEARRVCLGR